MVGVGAELIVMARDSGRRGIDRGRRDALAAIEARKKRQKKEDWARRGTRAASNAKRPGPMLMGPGRFRLSSIMKRAGRGGCGPRPARCRYPYFAYSTARLSRITFALIWPG